MLIFDLKVIGSKLYDIRNRKLMSRAIVAELAELSDRTYADIERGNVNMRLETLLKICRALGITPNDILVTEKTILVTTDTLENKIAHCSDTEKETALKLLDVYVNSIK